jgi:Pyruvate/2-oxoacid:ferredoxin oxidoreductase delta subunit
MSRRSSNFVYVRYAGLALFLVGLAGFVLSLFLGVYRITDDTFSDLTASGVVKEHQRPALYGELAALQDRDYRSTRRFLADVDRAIGEANDRLDDGNKIWDYDRGQYQYWIAHAAGTGPVAEGERPVAEGERAWFLASFVLASLGALVFFLARLGLETAGIRNDGVSFSAVKSRGWIGIALGLFLIAFYVGVYFHPAYIVEWIRLADPVSQALRGKPADQWFFYGLLYTFAVLVMGVRMLVQYRHSPYHLVRTGSIMFFQLGFAFLIPAVLASLNRPAYDFKNAWPLDYSFFYSYRLDDYTSGGVLGWFILVWGIALALLIVPLFSYLFGKRWYCSWVCGCGGLAETLGDPFRHLSNKRLRAWRAERWIVHGVLIFAVVLTTIVLVNYFSARAGTPLLGDLTWRVQSWYGFLISSIFAGVVGTGFYPLMGNRVWCRFGCPLAAILGLVQRFKSRFRITTNGGQCISCGNCSTYCEMGIDVRWYAQRGQNIVRASCVGCGICSAVCPRGVLRLENGPTGDRINGVSLLQIGGGAAEDAPRTLNRPA